MFVFFIYVWDGSCYDYYFCFNNDYVGVYSLNYNGVIWSFLKNSRKNSVI